MNRNLTEGHDKNSYSYVHHDNEIIKTIYIIDKERLALLDFCIVICKNVFTGDISLGAV